LLFTCKINKKATVPEGRGKKHSPVEPKEVKPLHPRRLLALLVHCELAIHLGTVGARRVEHVRLAHVANVIGIVCARVHAAVCAVEGHVGRGGRVDRAEVYLDAVDLDGGRENLVLHFVGDLVLGLAGRRQVEGDQGEEEND
jgi:hypothetical protein